MSVRVRVPTQRLAVTYVLAAGEPFTLVEEFMLRALDACGQNGATVDELASVLTMPRTVLLGSAEALIRAALVGLGGGTDRLVLTRHGRREVSLAPPSGPPPWQPMSVPAGFVSETETLSATVLMDLVHGLVAPDSPDRLLRQGTPALEPRKTVGDLVVSRLTAVLWRRYRHQWVARIVRVNPAGAPRYLAVRASPETGVISGLPREWDNQRQWADTLRAAGIW
ncbi:hypothetical protein [Actinophytocola sediminis]